MRFIVLNWFKLNSDESYARSVLGNEMFSPNSKVLDGKKRNNNNLMNGNLMILQWQTLIPSLSIALHGIKDPHFVRFAQRIQNKREDVITGIIFKFERVLIQ